MQTHAPIQLVMACIAVVLHCIAEFEVCLHTALPQALVTTTPKLGVVTAQPSQWWESFLSRPERHQLQGCCLVQGTMRCPEAVEAAEQLSLWLGGWGLYCSSRSQRQGQVGV
jgi:hypothetical protein